MACMSSSPSHSPSEGPSSLSPSPPSPRSCSVYTLCHLCTSSRTIPQPTGFDASILFSQRCKNLTCRHRYCIDCHIEFRWSNMWSCWACGGENISTTDRCESLIKSTERAEDGGMCGYKRDGACLKADERRVVVVRGYKGSWLPMGRGKGRNEGVELNRGDGEDVRASWEIGVLVNVAVEMCKKASVFVVSVVKLVWFLGGWRRRKYFLS